jgi:hypothetical protein
MLFAGVMFAQGNLQFNQVINQTITTPLGTGFSGSNNQTLVVTVPAGKVWKIESAHLSYQISTNTKYFVADATNENTQLVLNGGVIAVESDDFYKTPGPIWLAEGTHTFILQGFINSGSQYRWNAFITAIEFNIIP